MDNKETGGKDKSTYRLFYADTQKNEILKQLQEIFRTTSIINLEKIKTDKKLVLLVIESAISNNTVFYNKWVIPCFIRNDGNIIYLTEYLKSKLTDTYYVEYPMINESHLLSDIINRELWELDSTVLDFLQICDGDGSKAIECLDITTQIYILENLYILSKNKNIPDDKQAKIKNFLKLFKNNLFELKDGSAVHNLQKMKLKETSYIDFSIGEDGVLRCFDSKNNVWNNCETRKSYEISKKISSIKETRNKDIINNKYKVYGIISSDGKFKINDRRSEVKQADRRKVLTGVVCGTSKKYKKEGIQELLTYLYKVDKKPLPDTFYKSTIDQLCNILKRWFISNKLMIYE
jgi:hypothetical protein